jgi:hypothetical protein
MAAVPGPRLDLGPRRRFSGGGVPRSENHSDDTHGPRVPRSSVTLLAHTLAEHRAAQRRRATIRTVIGLVLIVAAIWSANVFLVSRPVHAALAADTALAGVRLDGHFQWYVDFRTLALDLRAADPAAPELAFRGMLVVADAMQRGGRSFGRVVLTRVGAPVFVLSGDDFLLLGGRFSSSHQPLDVLRAIPPMLRGTGGSDALGLFGAAVPAPLGERDLDQVARRWLQGTTH